MTKNHRVRWTKEDEQLLTDMWNNGATWDEMSSALGRTEESVSSCANYLSLPYRNKKRRRIWTPEMYDRLRELDAKGWKYMDIAEDLGVGVGDKNPAVTIAIARKEIGLPPRRIRRDSIEWTPEMVETLKRMWKEGASIEQLMQALGVPSSYAVAKAKELGLGYKRPARKYIDDYGHIDVISPSEEEDDGAIIGRDVLGAARRAVAEKENNDD